MKKRIIPLLSALLTVTLLAALALISGAQSTEPELFIAYCNLEFGQDTHILYAVTSEGVEKVDDIELLVWKTPQTDYTSKPDYTLSKSGEETISGDECVVFEFADLAAKNMTDNVYARAHIKGTDIYSPVNKYSVLQYAYNMLGKTKDATGDEALKTLLTDMLTYGASAQKYAKHNPTRLATADWYQVKLTAGTLVEDGCDHGLYLTGDKVKITAPATDKDGKAFEAWTNKAGETVSTTASFELTVGNKNEEYTPKYSSASAVKIHTVTFVDHDGKTLKTQNVESGKSATAPTDPTRDGYTFTGWDKKFDSVTADMTVTAQYKEITGPTIIVSDVTGAPGDEVEIVVSCKGFPKMYGLGLIVLYDDTVLEPVAARNPISAKNCLENGFSYTPPEPFKNGCHFIWEALDPVTLDGVVLKLNFKIKSDVSNGNYSITVKNFEGVTCDADKDYTDKDLSSAEGTIIVTN